MANRRFELFEYRQVLVRMRQGDSDHDIARGELMGRKKLAAVRRRAEQLGWLDPAQPLPDDNVIAGEFGRTPHLPSSCVSTSCNGVRAVDALRFASLICLCDEHDVSALPSAASVDNLAEVAPHPLQQRNQLLGFLYTQAIERFRGNFIADAARFDSCEEVICATRSGRQPCHPCLNPAIGASAGGPGS